jgi:hypothetical protein
MQGPDRDGLVNSKRRRSGINPVIDAISPDDDEKAGATARTFAGLFRSPRARAFWMDSRRPHIMVRPWATSTWPFRWMATAERSPRTRSSGPMGWSMCSGPVRPISMPYRRRSRGSSPWTWTGTGFSTIGGATRWSHTFSAGILGCGWLHSGHLTRRPPTLEELGRLAEAWQPYRTRVCVLLRTELTRSPAAGRRTIRDAS